MVTEVVTAEGAAAKVIDTSKKLRTSWMDWLVGALERLPAPTWLAYVGITLIALGIITLEGLTSRQGLSELLLAYIYTFFFVFPLAAYHYLSLGARSAWDQLRPATSLDDGQAARVRFELGNTPFRPVAIIWVASAAVYAFVSFAFPESTDLHDQPLAYFALRVVTESLWVVPTSFVLVYFVIRQLHIVARLHGHITRVNLLRPAPLHAMSRLTARSAMAIVVLAVVFALPLPNFSEAAGTATALFLSLPLLILAAAAFVLPLSGMQRVLSAERSRRLDEVDARVDASTASLHRLVDAGAGTNADETATRMAQARADTVNKSLESLLQERELLHRQSTWPWDPSTFRAVASAVLLPVFLFLLTRALDRFL